MFNTIRLFGFSPCLRTTHYSIYPIVYRFEHMFLFVGRNTYVTLVEKRGTFVPQKKRPLCLSVNTDHPSASYVCVCVCERSDIFPDNILVGKKLFLWCV